MSYATLAFLNGLLVSCGAGCLAMAGAARWAINEKRAALVGSALAGVFTAAAIVVLLLSTRNPSALFSIAANAANGSPKSLEFVGCIACLVLAVAQIVWSIRSSASADSAEWAGAALSIGCIAVGCTTAFASGMVCAIGKAAWGQTLLPLLNVGTSLMVGIGAVELGTTRETPANPLRIVGLVCLAIQAGLLVSCHVLSGFALDAPLFWLGCLGVGTAVPAALLALVRPSYLRSIALFAGTVVGAVCIRLIMTSLTGTSLGLIASMTRTFS